MTAKSRRGLDADATAPSRREPAGIRAFRMLLALYPAAFRDEYGRELALVFVDRYRDAAGRWDRIRLWLEALAGVLHEAPKEHARQIAYDLRDAWRSLRKSPGFLTTAIGTLALAIGANTAMVSVLNAVLLRPLPYRSPEQLAMVWTERPTQQVREGRTAFQTVEQWRDRSESFADLAAFDPASILLTSAADTQQIICNRVTPNFFAVLGVEPLLGRLFSAREALERERVALISHRLWQARFGGAPEAIGASIELDGRPSRIIGIMPVASQFPLAGADVWEPHTLSLDWDVARTQRGAGSWFVIGRLRPNVTIDRAQVEMSTIARGLDAQVPAATRGIGVSVVPLSVQVTDPRSRLALWMLTAAVLCVLLIAATNVAGLSLARSAGREREIAIRVALGASQSRIVRQLLVESVSLAIVAGLLGLLIALGGLRLILAIKPDDLARLDHVGLDGRVLAWSAALCLLTGILVGLAPAITTARRSLRASGQDGGRSVAGSASTRRLRRALVVSELALAIVLLVGAGLLIRSMWSIERVDPGFKPERVLLIQLSSPSSRPIAERADVYARLLEQVASVPGVERVGMIGNVFISSAPEQIVTTEGDARPISAPVRLRRDEVSGGFFATVGTPLLRGRVFSTEDGPGSPRVAIVNEAMARRVWPGRDPIGQRFTFGAGNSASSWWTVVGLVADMHRQGLEQEPIPQMFEPLAHNPSRLATLLVRTSVDDPLAMAASVRAAVQRVDTRTPLYGVSPLDRQLARYLAPRRFQTSLLIAFAIVALLMAAIGIYGLIQYSIATRTHEIGIRMAIGASAADIFRLIVREGLTLTVTGLLLGLVGAWWLGQAGSSLLFGVGATDPTTFLSVSLLLIAVALAACIFPARRAMRIEPIIAMRQAEDSEFASSR